MKKIGIILILIILLSGCTTIIQDKANLDALEVRIKKLEINVSTIPVITDALVKENIVTKLNLYHLGVSSSCDNIKRRLILEKTLLGDDSFAEAIHSIGELNGRETELKKEMDYIGFCMKDVENGSSNSGK